MPPRPLLSGMDKQNLGRTTSRYSVTSTYRPLPIRAQAGKISEGGKREHGELLADDLPLQKHIKRSLGSLLIFIKPGTVLVAQCRLQVSMIHGSCSRAIRMEKLRKVCRNTQPDSNCNPFSSRLSSKCELKEGECLLTAGGDCKDMRATSGNVARGETLFLEEIFENLLIKLARRSSHHQINNAASQTSRGASSGGLCRAGILSTRRQRTGNRFT